MLEGPCEHIHMGFVVIDVLLQFCILCFELVDFIIQFTGGFDYLVAALALQVLNELILLTYFSAQFLYLLKLLLVQFTRRAI